MKRKIKKFVLIFSTTILLVVLLAFFLVFKIRSSFDHQTVLTEIQAKNVFPKSQDIPFGEFTIHTNYTGNLNNQKVLFIHGSPGYWFDFKNIITDSTLLEKFCLITFDRPGYGKTSVPSQANLNNQAEIVDAVMQHFQTNNEKFIVLGHSYGGAVLEQTILNYSKKIKHAIYVAPCLSPKHQEAKWYNLLISGGLPNKIMPHELRTSNLEMMALSECLEKNEQNLKDIKVPTTYIQGKKDILVPYQTLDYYKSHHQNIDFSLLDELNHFVPWSNPEIIIKNINKLQSTYNSK